MHLAKDKVAEIDANIHVGAQVMREPITSVQRL